MAKERMTPLVLVAEDDGDILDLIVMVLEDEEYEVVKAGNGEKAVELAKKHGPDLCIIDVMMPKLNGTEVTKKLRSLKKTRETPIILLSARTQWEAVVSGREAGADEYLTKPFVAEDLTRSIRSLLTRTPELEHPDEEPALKLLAEAEAAEEAPTVPSGLVLVAAPNQNLVHLVSYRLGLGGFEVATAHDHEEAEQLASERQPDLCLLDASMPELDGYPVKRIDDSVSIQELYGEVEQLLARKSG